MSAPIVVNLKCTSTIANNVTVRKHEVDSVVEHELQSNVFFNPCDDLEIVVENQDKMPFTETVNDFPSKWEFEDFPLTPSPLVRTPPYEYIFLTKENEPKFRIYLNPRMDQVFQKELASLKKQSNSETSSKRDLSSPVDKDDIIENNNLSSNSTHSPSSLLNTKSSITIHCFDPSDMELELKHIFIENPPVTHKIVRRKPRKERGSSVAGIDSYYGTKDLAKVGHASYFIPALTPSERKAIGWKEEYCYGRWKYNTSTAGSMQNSISGHLRLLRSTLSIKVNKSNHSHSNPNRTTSTSRSRGAPSNHSHGHLTFSTPYTGTSKESNPSVSKGTIYDDKETQRYITVLPHENIPSVSEAGRVGSSLVNNNFVPRSKNVIRRFFTWLVPCTKKSKKHKTEEVDDQSSCSSSDSDCHDGGLQESNPSQEGKTVSSHHHRHHTIGCFSRHHHHHKNQFIGGDIIVSPNDSVASIEIRQDPGIQEHHPTLSVWSKDHLEQALESRMADDVTADSMMNETIETVFEIQEQSLENNASALVIRLLNVDKTNCEQNLESNPNEKAKIQLQNLKDLEGNLITSDVGRMTILKDKNDNLDQATSVSTVGCSTILSTGQVSPFMQLSPISSVSHSHYSCYGEPPDIYHEDYVDDDEEESGVNFISELIQNAKYHDMPEKVYQFNPLANYNPKPETRFLDLKDLHSSRFTYENCSVAETNQNLPDYDYYLNEENENILWSEEENDKLTTDDIDDKVFKNYGNHKWADEDDYYFPVETPSTASTNIYGISNLLINPEEDKSLAESSDNINSNVQTNNNHPNDY